MRYLATLALAAAFAGGLAATAHATPFEAFEADVLQAAPGIPDSVADHPYHRCHGRSTGTAHASCGTMTGGPSGGLF